jgi:hypothetical protein
MWVQAILLGLTLVLLLRVDAFRSLATAIADFRLWLRALEDEMFGQW